MNSTHQRIAQLEGWKRKVCSLLNITEEEYANRQYKAGCSYLQAYIPNDPTGIDQLLTSPVYWAWWRNHWGMRDKAFCDHHVEQLSMGTKADLYADLHDPYKLAECIRPNGVVLELAYPKMIQKVHQQL